MITFLSGYASRLNLTRKIMTRHRNERFRGLLVRCDPLRSTVVSLGEGSGTGAERRHRPLNAQAAAAWQGASSGSPFLRNRAR